MIVKGYGIWIKDTVAKLHYLNNKNPVDLEGYENMLELRHEYGTIGILYTLLNRNVQMFDCDYNIYGDDMGFYLIVFGDFLRGVECRKIDTPPDNKILLKFLKTCKKLGVTIKKKDIKFIEFDTFKDDWLK